MNKFKVGDIVRATEATNDRYLITNESNGCIGKVVDINDWYKPHIRDRFWVDPSMFELVTEKQEIHITVDDSKVVAVMKKNGEVVKRSEAKCHPNDTFDFETSAKLAFDRLFKEEKKCDTNFKVGDRVRFRSWEDMEKEFGVDNDLDIIKTSPYYFIKSFMGHLCGTYATISYICRDRKNILLEDFTSNGCTYFNYSTDMIEKVSEKPKFVPHLERFTGEFLGKLGTPTNFKDAIGRPLCIGDTVELFDSNLKSLGEEPICNDEGQDFVMGIKYSCNSETGEISQHNWKIIKKRSYEDINDGEIIDGVKYIKEEKK